MKIDFSSEDSLAGYPPYYFLRQILKNCPKAGYTYFLFWENKNNENKAIIPKEEVRSKYFSHLAKFRHDILLLEKEGLINVFENENEMVVELVMWDQIDGDGYVLC